MGQHEYDRIRSKNDKFIYEEALKVLDKLMNTKDDVMRALIHGICHAENETQADIFKRARLLYEWRRNIKEIEKRFGPYIDQKQNTIRKFEALQKKTLELALLIENLCPLCEEKSYAFNLLQQAKMTANAAIAIYNED